MPLTRFRILTKDTLYCMPEDCYLLRVDIVPPGGVNGNSDIVSVMLGYEKPLQVTFTSEATTFGRYQAGPSIQRDRRYEVKPYFRTICADSGVVMIHEYLKIDS